MKKLLQKLALYPDKTDIKSWLISYLFINITFLFHSLNFMWGNHDVAFVKERLYLSSGLFEGRFTQFIPYILLTNGQILPLLNNLIGFTFLTLGLWLLAKYWTIPKSTLNYTLFIIFAATQPYTLSWLYFSLYTISCFLWVFIAILGLYLSMDIHGSKHKSYLFILSTLCFYFPLGGYPPIINTFFVCLAGKITIEYLIKEKTIKQLIKQYQFTILSIITAALLFKLTLWILPHKDVYNLETTSINDLPLKLLTTLKISFSQFFIAVPFMEKGYKFILAIFSFIAILFAITTAKNNKSRMIIIILLISTIWATALTTLLVVPHTEYVSRIDFYGYAFLYAFFLSLLLNFKIKLSHSIALGFMIILIPFNFLNDYRAQRVWKLGSNAEFEILDRITERIENHPNFKIDKKYRLHIVGDISLRPMYYHGKYDIDDVFMLSLPYLAMWQGANLAEFYMPFHYINRQLPLLPTDITPDVYDFFMYQAAPFPSEKSVYINKDIIVLIYNAIGLAEFRTKLRELYPQN